MAGYLAASLGTDGGEYLYRHLNVRLNSLCRRRSLILRLKNDVLTSEMLTTRRDENFIKYSE